ncbi:glycoside hydrolase family 3 N-terminal domain-containing protein [Veillonella atypica]|uniref:glycoside hydrolase family 3 N-terminal domain-containing protein n=1 Tax=Veillonella atypica TaxID=39777 RepID=UPI0023AEF29C|nr:glycoside hydrolase family 3 N-terminal domain-containing protein [Veillonella atypica]MDE8713927.1 glycoside hydrolase family 3 N-terminal domain-containing protein [Veillonella atypica]
MKQFVKRLACGVLAIATMGTLVGCSREAPSTTESSDRVPVGYKAIAAMNASAAEKADRSVRTMSREDKIGQLMFIGLQGTTFDESQKELIRKYRVGGILLDHDNMESKEQVRAFTQGIRDTANTSSLMMPFVAMNRERMQYRPNLMLPWTDPKLLSKQGLDAVSSLATRTAIEMRDLGFNLNLGVMVNTHSFYSYTSDVDRAARIGETITKRYAANHVFTGYEYFPGGADYTVPGMKLEASKASLMDDDGRVFAQLIDATGEEHPMIMVNAVKVTSIDANHPVSLSKPIITDWLRKELGFEGVVITDDIEVGAAVAGMSIEDYAVRTINAGSDMIIVCKHAKHIKDVHDALTQAVENGTISEARLDESVRRIMLMKFSNEQ